MRNLLLCLTLLLSLNCFSQITQTWYLYSLQTNDFAPIYITPNMSPPVSATLTLNADLTYTAQGICSTMNGTWDYFFGQALTFTGSTGSTNCSNPTDSDFDNAFINYLGMNTLQYYLSSDNTTLMLTSPLFGLAVFRNYQLQSPGFDAAQVTVYPNPAHTTISLTPGNNIVTKVEFINALGQSTKTVNDTFETIDIADLPTGIYILKISSESGSVNKKIIKT